MSHPLLRGGRPSYSHGLSSAELESLSALCETIIPSIFSHFNDDDTSNFYSTSGSQNGLPEYIAGLVGQHCPKLGIMIIRLVLACLSTQLGTFLLCGRESLSPKQTYFLGCFPRRFSEIPVGVRERILLQWSQGTGSVFDAFFALVFKTFKNLCTFCFFSKADEKGWNPTWKAIGYEIPSIHVENPHRPLDGKIIDVGSTSQEKVMDFLEDAGLEVNLTNLEEESDEITKSKQGNEKFLKVNCDAVVIGSGAGGSVVAAKLAEKGYSVIVVEKGRYFSGDDFSLLEGPSMDQMYAKGGILSTMDCKVSILAGSTVGGGSTINWSASVRTPEHVLTEWSHDLGLDMFKSDEYPAAMDEVCSRLGVNICGETQSFQNTVLRKGCSALGYEVEDVPVNATPPHSCGSCNFGCKQGHKKATTTTWLVDAINSNARILTNCEVLHITHKPSRSPTATATATATATSPTTTTTRPRTATGVLCSNNILITSRVTVVACGALMTPPLLKSSGLKNPHIGKHLHLHPVRMAWGYFPDTQSPQGKIYEGGIITTMCKERSHGYGTIIQTPALPPGCFSVLMPWVSGLDFKDRMTKYPRTAHLFALTRDRSEGTVGPHMEITYADPTDHPCDGANMEDGLVRALRILMAAGASEVGTHHSDGYSFRVDGASEDEKEEFLKQVRLRDDDRRRKRCWCPVISAHQMGSCRMGTDARSSAVDTKCESWDVGGVFVADASVLPTAVGVNPMITIEAVSLCISHRVCDYLRNEGGNSS